MSFLLSSRRLGFRELLEKDVQDIYQLDSDPEVHRYLGNHPIHSLDEAARIIQKVRKQYDEHGVGRWAVIDKQTGECLGWCGFKVESQEWKEGKYIDLGYRFKAKHWGKGYGFEAALACLHYGFEQMALKEICAAAHVDNQGSNRIIQKLGLQWKKTFEFDGSMHNWYELSRLQWNERKSSP
jgi:ribosomal-protein-alanine N-acetyltransferase